jgi:hypothetical protein
VGSGEREVEGEGSGEREVGIGKWRERVVETG